MSKSVKGKDGYGFLCLVGGEKEVNGKEEGCPFHPEAPHCFLSKVGTPNLCISVDLITYLPYSN